MEILRQLKGSFSSKRTLRRHFTVFLANPPKVSPLKSRRSIYLKVDGKYFGHWGCILVFKERTSIIFWDFVQRENYFNYLNDFYYLKKLGYDILGVTSDWHGSLISAVKTSLPKIPHQRCLVHTLHLCQGLLTKHPETEAGTNLLELVSLLNNVKNQKEKTIWLTWLNRFEKRYGDLIKQRTYHEDKRHWWFTHRNLRRAFLTLKNSQDHLFIHLDNPNIEKDTNGLESEFSHLTNKLGNHRGLKREKTVNFVNWYFYLKSIYFENPNTT